MKQHPATIVLGISLLLTGILLSGCKTIPSSNNSSSSSSSSSSNSSSSSSSSNSSSSSGSMPSTSPSSRNGSVNSQTGFPTSQTQGSASTPDTSARSGSQTPGSADPSNPPYASTSGENDEIGGEYQEGGESEMDGDGQSAGSAQTGNSSGDVLSSEEQISVLEGELDRSVAVFDGMILDERATIQGIEDANQDQGYPEGNTNAPLFEEGDLAGSGSDDGTDQGIPTMPGNGSVEAPGSGEVTAAHGSKNGIPTKTASAAGAIPADVKDGSDDDIVARQIREAAMKETDPELREKLWDEYRKYKNQNK